MLVITLSLLIAISTLASNIRVKCIALSGAIGCAMMFFREIPFVAFCLYPMTFFPLVYLFFHCKEDPYKVSLRKFRKKVYLEKVLVVSCLLMAISFAILKMMKNPQKIANEAMAIGTGSSESIIIALTLVLAGAYYYFRGVRHD